MEYKRQMNGRGAGVGQEPGEICGEGEKNKPKQMEETDETENIKNQQASFLLLG